MLLTLLTLEARIGLMFTDSQATRSTRILPLVGWVPWVTVNPEEPVPVLWRMGLVEMAIKSTFRLSWSPRAGARAA